jgi:ubiquinone biosynthesis protein Coq4
MKPSQNEMDYLRGGKKPLSTDSSVLISSSKYLNSSAMRFVAAQEMLRKYGTDLPPAYSQPDIISAFGELKDQDYILRLFEAERQNKPEFAQWMEDRFISKFVPAELEQFGPGTLGRMVYEFVTISGFDIDFMFRDAPNNDYQYWLKRFIQSHDIQHMVTGLDVTPIGEYALGNLNTTNYYDYFSPELAAELCRETTFSLSCALMRANMHYQKTAPLLFDALIVGREMAKGLKRPLFFVRWEDYFGYTIEEIREALNIVGAPASGAWAWAYEEMKK